MADRLRTWLAAVAVVLPPVGVLVYVLRFGVDVPYWDEWMQIPLLRHAAAGALTWSDLFAQHNEHRILFPRLVMLLVDRLTAFDLRVQMVVGWAFLVLAFGALYLAWRRLRGGSRARTLLELVPVAWFFFSLRQNQNLLWGWQLQINLCLLLTIVSLALLSRPTHGRVAGAGAAAVVATFCFANGLLVFPVGAIGLASHREARHRLAWLGSWLALGTATLGVYLWGWKKPEHHPSELDFLRHPLEALRYLLASQGSPFTSSLSGAVWAGAGCTLLLVLAALLYRRRSLPFGLLLGLFSLATGAILMVGRVGFGAEQALSSRYVSFTLLAMVGAYESLCEAWDRSPAARALCGVCAAAMVASVPASIRSGMADGRSLRAFRSTLWAILPSYASLSDEAVGRFFVAPYVREQAPFLEQARLSVFRRPVRRIDEPVPFAVEQVRAGPEAADGKGPTLEVTGWAADPRAKTRAAAVLVRVDGAPFEVAEAGRSRPDVAAAQQQRGYLASGFECRLPAPQRGVREHTVSLRIVTEAGDYYDASAVVPLAAP